MALTQGFFHISGWLYDGFLGTMLRNVRKRVANEIVGEGLFPCLDICCGTGSQGRAIARRAKRQTKNWPSEIEERPAKSDSNVKAAHQPQKQEQKSPNQRNPGFDTTGQSLISAGSIVGLDLDCGILRFAAYRAPSLPFFCGDAAALPFKNGTFNSAVLSFALHHLTPEERVAIIHEARRVLAPSGKIVFVDFEHPWNRASRWGARFRDLIERMPGDPHYGNGREFLSLGGLRAFIRENGFEERARYDVWAGAFGVVVAARADFRPRTK